MIVGHSIVIAEGTVTQPRLIVTVAVTGDRTSALKVIARTAFVGNLVTRFIREVGIVAGRTKRHVKFRHELDSFYV